MSVVATKVAYKLIGHHKMDPSARLVLLALADCHNQETGRCDPSNSNLAKMTGYPPRTVERALAQLRRLGLIKVTPRRGRNISNMYTILDVKKSADGTPQCIHKDASGGRRHVGSGTDVMSDKPETYAGAHTRTRAGARERLEDPAKICDVIYPDFTTSRGPIEEPPAYTEAEFEEIASRMPPHQDHGVDFPMPEDEVIGGRG